MRVWYIGVLIYLIFLTACTQMKSINSPPGISLLKEIDPVGLQDPIWSPDGAWIVASSNIEPMADFCFSCPIPRHDIVMLDTVNWVAHFFLHENSGIMTQAWSKDSKSFAVWLSNGPNGDGIYGFNLGDYKVSFLSKDGTLSPDWEKIAKANGAYISIMPIHSRNIIKFNVPTTGPWNISAWSPDMKQLTLVQGNRQLDSFENIYILELTTGKFTQFTNDQSYFKNNPIISANGEFVAYEKWRYTATGVEEKLIISRLDKGCERIVPLVDIGSFTWSPDSQRIFIIGSAGVYIADLRILFGRDFINGNSCR